MNKPPLYQVRYATPEGWAVIRDHEDKPARLPFYLAYEWVQRLMEMGLRRDEIMQVRLP